MTRGGRGSFMRTIGARTSSGHFGKLSLSSNSPGLLLMYQPQGIVQLSRCGYIPPSTTTKVTFPRLVSSELSLMCHSISEPTISIVPRRRESHTLNHERLPLEDSQAPL